MSRSLRTKRHKALCQALIDARKAAGLTQQDLADRLGRPQSFVAKIEGGERRLDVVEFVELAEAVETDAGAILARFRSMASKVESS